MPHCVRASAYFDDIYVLCDPDRVAEIFVQVRHALFHQAGIQVNLEKTKVWNGAAVKQTNMRVVGDDDWKGEGLEEERCLVVLGVPLGPHAFVRSQVELLSRISAVQDAQSAWLLLLMCAGPRENNILRNVPPSEVSDFCQNHDNHLRACLADIIAMPVPDGVTTKVVQLPFREGLLGLRTAARLAPAACWASWADCLSQVVARAPGVHTAWKDRHPEHCVFGKPNTLPQCLQQKAWRCQSGPHSRTLTSAPRSPSIPRWESGLMVGNFTHLLLATPSLQHACICHLSELTTKLCGHLNVGRALQDISPASPPARRPLSQRKSSARCSSSDCICPSTWMTDSANAEHGRMCLATIDPLAHGSAC